MQIQVSRGLPTASDPRIHFRDALGRVKELPYEWFQHYEVFVSMLRCSFQHSPGENLVLAGMFSILDIRGKRREVSQDNWKQIVVPESKLGMAILLDRGYFKKSHCPLCSSEMITQSHVSPSFVHCFSCDLKYVRSSEASLNRPLLLLPRFRKPGRARFSPTEQPEDSINLDDMAVFGALHDSREAVNTSRDCAEALPMPSKEPLKGPNISQLGSEEILEPPEIPSSRLTPFSNEAPNLVWWYCCHCNHINSPALCGGRCTLCGHVQCANCRPS